MRALRKNMPLSGDWLVGTTGADDARVATSAGIMAGLVSISACGGTCEPYAAAIIGAAAGLVCGVIRTIPKPLQRWK